MGNNTSGFETQARKLLGEYCDSVRADCNGCWDPTCPALNEETVSKVVKALTALHCAERNKLPSMSDAERYSYEDYKRQHIQALEDYHEFGKAPVGSPERMAAYVSYLSPWNLRNGADALKEWREKAVRESQAAAVNNVLERVEKEVISYGILMNPEFTRKELLNELRNVQRGRLNELKVKLRQEHTGEAK